MNSRRKRFLKALDDDIADHIDRDTAENIERGMDPKSARDAALRSFGNITHCKEDTRAVWISVWLEQLLQDLRYGVRMLYRNIGFSSVAILALALGIGVNTAVFTAYRAMVVRPLDARDPGGMVNFALVRDSGASDFTFSYPDYEAYRDSLHSFSGLIAFRQEHMRLSNAGGVISPRGSSGSALKRLGLPSSPARNADLASVFIVSENYFKVLGVAALRGRTFDSMSIPELVASHSILISENYSQKRFANDPAVLGRTIRLNGLAFTVVGITPHDFVGTNVAVPDFWLPISLEPLIHADENWLRDRETQRYRLFARLAPGASISRARAETTVVFDRLRMLHDPASESAKPATVLVWLGSPFPLPLNFYSGLILTILLIMSAAGMVLLVACANVGSLQLARARSRQAELHTRLSLGAGRVRIVRQLLTESALLGLLAGGLALLFTEVLLKLSATFAMESMSPGDDTLILVVTPDLEIFVYVFAVSLFAGILFGLVPAIESSRSPIVSAARGGTSPVRSRRIQDLLIATQVALSLVLMIAGSMLIRSSTNALTMETGYDSKHLVDLDLQFSGAPKDSAARKSALVHELRTRLADVPGVTAITSARPPSDIGFRTAAVSLDGEASPIKNVQSMLHYTYVQANYFQTLRIPLFLGRSFQSQGGQPEHSVVLSESAAKLLWPGQNPIGRSLRLGPTDERVHHWRELLANGAAYQVIGVARDTRGSEFDGSDSKQVYLPMPADRLPNYSILIQTQEPAQVIRAIDPVISSIDPDLVISPSTLEEILRRSPPFIASRLAAAVASTLGLLGLLLASMGIYGTVSYIVVLRTREIGIRMAVGAQKRDVLGLVLRESTRPVLGGLVGGMFLAVGASYLLRGVLYGLKTVDSFSFGGMSVLFFTVSLLAAYPPSRRAMRVDPVVALRYD
jgi:macrolide transport system ATP-binding/permease protein